MLVQSVGWPPTVVGFSVVRVQLGRGDDGFPAVLSVLVQLVGWPTAVVDFSLLLVQRGGRRAELVGLGTMLVQLGRVGRRDALHQVFVGLLVQFCRCQCDHDSGPDIRRVLMQLGDVVHNPDTIRAVRLQLGDVLDQLPRACELLVQLFFLDPSFLTPLRGHKGECLWLPHIATKV